MSNYIQPSLYRGNCTRSIMDAETRELIDKGMNEHGLTMAQAVAWSESYVSGITVNRCGCTLPPHSMLQHLISPPSCGCE